MRKQILILLGFSFSLIACQQNEEIGSVEDNANPNESCFYEKGSYTSGKG